MHRMSKATLKVKEHVQNKFSEFDWDLMESLTKSLEPVAELTTRMQAAEYVLGDFYRDLFMCEDSLKNLEGATQDI